LISCAQDTPRVVEPEISRSVFELQEKVIENILQSFQEQQALERIPRTIDPIQQTMATAIQGYLNHPEVDRRVAVEAIRFLNQPMMTVQIRELRQAYKDFQMNGSIMNLFEIIKIFMEEYGDEKGEELGPISDHILRIAKEDLRLICFDLISGG
jgi:hypothetical protein